MARRYTRLIPFVSLLLALWSTGALAGSDQGSDQLVTELRVDLPAVYNARDYETWVWTQAGYEGPRGYTTGWFGVDTAQDNGQRYSAGFTQVGLYNDTAGVHWFFYSEAGSQPGGVVCQRPGSIPSWGGFGCVGQVGDMGVGSLLWNKVELVTYGDAWIARVYDQNDYPFDVAYGRYTSIRIYRAQQTAEEAYDGSPDPRYFLNYAHWHPVYMVWGQGWTEWPASSGGNNNFLHTWSQPAWNFCPELYGAEPNLYGDPRYWWTYRGGQTCSRDPMF